MVYPPVTHPGTNRARRMGVVKGSRGGLRTPNSNPKEKNCHITNVQPDSHHNMISDHVWSMETNHYSVQNASFYSSL